jgi:hypothetical protein
MYIFRPRSGYLLKVNWKINKAADSADIAGAALIETREGGGEGNYKHPIINQAIIT